MRNRMYGGVRGKETKIGRKTFVSLPTRFFLRNRVAWRRAVVGVRPGCSVVLLCFIKNVNLFVIV